ncbi:MAG: hypothetical protein WC149_12655 [Arcobacteraceae bacterium]
MKQFIVILFVASLITSMFSGCSKTFEGAKKDSSKAWEATKDGSVKAWENTKEAIHEATE